MTAPLNARLDDEGRRFYTWQGERYWSVTTLIDMGVPKYLVPWANKLIAEAAYADVARYGKRALGVWEKAGRHYVSMLQAQGALVSLTPAKLAKMTPAEFALRWLKGTPERVRDAAAARGSKVHEQSEEIVKARADEAARLVIAGADHAAILARFDDETRPYMASFLTWVRDFRPRFEATEATVYNRTAGYAGTLDAMVWLPYFAGATEQRESLVIVDYKSGKNVYPEVALQLAAYANGDFVGMPDGSEAMLPRVDAAAVLHLTPTGYEFRQVSIGDPIYRAFLYACEVARFRLETASTVIGEPILPDLGDSLAASLEAVGG